MTRAAAAKIASQLPLGMAEREMYRVLETNGLKWVYTKEIRPARAVSLEEVEAMLTAQTTAETNPAPAAEAWCLYALSDGCLRLDVSLESATSTNRVLRAAYVYAAKDRSKPESITLTNRP